MANQAKVSKMAKQLYLGPQESEKSPFSQNWT